MEEFLSLPKLILAICERLERFTGDGDFRVAMSFIEGYVGGRGGVTAQQYGDFRRWLANRLYEENKTPRNYALESYIKQMSEDDKERFRILENLFHQYQSEPGEMDIPAEP